MIVRAATRLQIYPCIFCREQERKMYKHKAAIANARSPIGAQLETHKPKIPKSRRKRPSTAKQRAQTSRSPAPTLNLYKQKGGQRGPRDEFSVEASVTPNTWVELYEDRHAATRSILDHAHMSSPQQTRREVEDLLRGTLGVAGEPHRRSWDTFSSFAKQAK